MKADRQLQSDIESELSWEPSLNAAHVEVAVERGVVTLRGSVPSYPEKLVAELAAKRVYGVVAVLNEIDVKLANPNKRSDEELASLCVAALRSHSSIPDDQLKLTVHDGWITVEGEVGWQYQRMAIESALQHLTGVVGLIDHVTVTADVSPLDVKRKIDQAFKRNAEIDACRITVETHGAAVTLRGKVRSWSERAAAERAAWGAPGVASVEDALTVVPDLV